MVGQISAKISVTIATINYNTTEYYSPQSDNYIIKAGNTVTIAKTDSNLELIIPE